MTIEEMLGVAEIVERATNRFNEQAARFRERSAAYDRLVRDDAERAAVAKRLVEERDALRAEVTDLRGIFDMVHASLGIKPGDHIGRAVEALKKLSPKYKVGDKLESYNRSLGLAIPVTVVGVRTVYDCQGDGAEYPIGHSESELKARYADHDTPAGKEAAASVIRNSQVTEIKAGTTLRLCKAPKPEPQLSGLVEFPWNEEWGSVGDVAEVINTLDPASIPAVAVRLESGLVVWWPRSCIEIVRKVPQ